MDVAQLKKRWLEVVVLVAILGVGAWFFLRPHPETGLVKGNGRIEATEIDVSTKIAGKLRDLPMDEGDFVEARAPSRNRRPYRRNRSEAMPRAEISGRVRKMAERFDLADVLSALPESLPLLPDPLEPRKPKISPRWMRKLT
jgi:hypothetical protein